MEYIVVEQQQRQQKKKNQRVWRAGCLAGFGRRSQTNKPIKTKWKRHFQLGRWTSSRLVVTRPPHRKVVISKKNEQKWVYDICSKSEMIGWMDFLQRSYFVRICRCEEDEKKKAGRWMIIVNGDAFKQTRKQWHNLYFMCAAHRLLNANIIVWPPNCVSPWMGWLAGRYVVRAASARGWGRLKK